jgi:Anti-sigma-K factor rskA
MSAMDHGSAHERIEDLLLDPARLAALDSSPEPEDKALRDHVAGCPACRADLDGWTRLQGAVSDALPELPEAAIAAVEPMEPPPSLRTRVIAAVRPVEAPLAPVSRLDAAANGLAALLAVPRRAWLGTALMMAIILVGAGVILDQAARISLERAHAESLGEAVAAVDRVLAEPKHRVVALNAPDGTASGSISWSRHDWVVLTSALSEPRPDQRYKCWLEDGSRSVAVGVMEFADGTAYWVATVDDWKTWEIEPTTQFVVSLEPAGAQTRTGGIVLAAQLGS